MSLLLKIIAFVLVLLAVYAGYQYYRTRQIIEVGKKLAAEAVPYEQHPEDSELRILNIGDSSVVGTGAQDNTKTIAGRLGADYPSAEVVNLGVNGTKTHELVERFEGIQDQRFDLVVIHTGGNDIVRFTNLKELEESITQVLTLASNIGETVVVLHGGNIGTSELIPAGVRWAFTLRTKQVRDIFVRIAEEQDAWYVDLWRLGGYDPFGTDPDKYYAADRFHLSNDGYGEWYRFISGVIAETPFAEQFTPQQ